MYTNTHTMLLGSYVPLIMEKKKFVCLNAFIHGQQLFQYYILCMR